MHGDEADPFLTGLYEEVSNLRHAEQLARQELKRASHQAYAAIQASGTPSSKVGQRTALSDSTIRKLGLGKQEGRWSPQTPAVYAAVDSYCVKYLGIDFGLAPALSHLATAISDREKAEERLRAAGIDLDTLAARRRAVGRDLEAYLAALVGVLGTTSSWLPYGDLDAGFERRMVTVRDEPPAPDPGKPLFAARSARRGDVSWDRAVEDVPVAVMLADAGYGKTWLLRHHGRRLARAALAEHQSGADPESLALPLWVHAQELATAWLSGKPPAEALLAAAMLLPRSSGFAASTWLRRFLSGRLRVDAAPVHVLVDAYDEVFDDQNRAALDEALTWLGGLARLHSGPRLVLTSRPSGYADPFRPRSLADDVDPELEFTAPRYCHLGILEEHQVRQVWSRWFELRRQPTPMTRLEPAIAPRSPLRQFVHVPLIAAFCAWVAEEDTVAGTRSALYEQVVRRFLGQSWKTGPVPGGSLRQDGARRREIENALTELAWEMSAGTDAWRDAIDVGDCEVALTAGGLTAGPGRSRVWDPLRAIGILVQAGSSPWSGPVGEGPVLWVHRSVHEFLSARRLLSLPDEQIRTLLDERCWFSPEWGDVLDFALGLELAHDGEHRLTRMIRDIVAQDGDGLGWLATVLASAGGERPMEPTPRDDIIEYLWRLHQKGFISAVTLAEALATTASVDHGEVAAAVSSRLGTSPDQETWEALAWCGDLGRSLLSGIISREAHAAGAAGALYNVDPPAAVAAVRRRIRAGLTLGDADAVVVADLGEPDIELVKDRYLTHPASEGLGKVLGWTRHELGRHALLAHLASDDPQVRQAAALGLLASHGNDIDRDTFEALASLARRDPDEKTRMRIRSRLTIIGSSVPWVESALADIVGDLYHTPDMPSLDSFEAIADALLSGGSATELAVQMLLEGPELEQGPVRPALHEVTQRALLGEYDLRLTKKIALVVGRDHFIEPALTALARVGITRMRLVRLAVGLCLAFPADETVYTGVLSTAPRYADAYVEGALALSELPPDRRLEILLDQFSALTGSNPAAVRLWTSVAARILSELPGTERHRFREMFALTTSFVLALP